MNYKPGTYALLAAVGIYETPELCQLPGYAGGGNIPETHILTFEDAILKEYRQLLNQMVNRAESFIGDRNEWKNGKITDDSIKEKYGPWVKGYFKSGGDFH